MKKNLLFLFFFIFCGNILSATELIVQLKSGTEIELFLKLHKSNFPELKFEKTLSKSWNIFLLEIPESDKNKFSKVAYSQGNIIHLQENRKAKARQTSPNDPGYAQQWHHNNTGINGGTAGADIQSELAWDFATGANGVTAMGDTIVIAIVDEGVDLQCNDIHLWKNYNEIPGNGIDDDNNGYIDDYDGWNAFSQNGVILPKNHGTKVAGIAAGIGNNNYGISGISWNAKVLPVVVSDYSEAEIIIAYSYLYDQRKLYNQSNGAKGAYIVVANSSFGVDYAFEDEYPIWCALYDSLGSVGILSVSAATNFANNVDISGDIPSLCSSEYLIAVSSSNRNDQLAAAGYGKKNIDLVAPGVAIYSVGYNNQFGASSGTSFSAPMVSGAVALLYAAACDSFFLKNSDVSLIAKRFILEGAEWLSVLTGKIKSNGRLNVYRSLELFLSEQCTSCTDFEANKSEISCVGSNDGSLNIEINDAHFPLSYQWSDGANDSFRHAIKSGQYFITITDSNACQNTIQVRFQDPDPVFLYLNSSPELNDEKDGTASVMAEGGRPPYSYQWSNGDTLASISNLSSGWIYLNLQDQNGAGCLFLDSVFVENTIVGIEVNKDFSFQAFPNPSTEKINLQFENTQLIRLLNLKGEILQQHITRGRKSLEIEKGNLAAGIYLLQIMDSNNSSTYRKVIFH